MLDAIPGSELEIEPDLRLITVGLDREPVESSGEVSAEDLEFDGAVDLDAPVVGQRRLAD